MNTLKEETAGQARMLRRTEAARYITDTFGIPCSPKTLAKLACVRSDGPPFRKAGPYPLYPTEGLDDWARGKIGPLVRSTSDRGTEADSGKASNNFLPISATGGVR